MNFHTSESGIFSAHSMNFLFVLKTTKRKVWRLIAWGDVLCAFTITFWDMSQFILSSSDSQPYYQSIHKNSTKKKKRMTLNLIQNDEKEEYVIQPTPFPFHFSFLNSHFLYHQHLYLCTAKNSRLCVSWKETKKKYFSTKKELYSFILRWVEDWISLLQVLWMNG
jgi:hypothetical protein